MEEILPYSECSNFVQYAYKEYRNSNSANKNKVYLVGTSHPASHNEFEVTILLRNSNEIAENSNFQHWSFFGTWWSYCCWYYNLQFRRSTLYYVKSVFVKIPVIGRQMKGQRIIQSITTLRKGQGNPIRVSMICNPQRGLLRHECCKSRTRGWDSLVPSASDWLLFSHAFYSFQ